MANPFDAALQHGIDTSIREDIAHLKSKRDRLQKKLDIANRCIKMLEDKLKPKIPEPRQRRPRYG